MNEISSVPLFNNTDELTQYLDAVYNTVMEKINNGTKRILFALPTGCGKTKMLLRIAGNLCIDGGKSVLLVVNHKAIASQAQQRSKEFLPEISVVTYDELKKSNFLELENKTVILVDDLFISDRKDFATRLIDYKGYVISASNNPFDFQR